MDLRLACPWLALALIAACGGQTGGSGIGPSCIIAAPVPVDPSEVTPAGFSGDDALALAQGEHTFAARWPLLDSGAASATLVITSTSDEARYVESHSSVPAALPEEMCPDQVEVDVHIELSLENERGAAHAAFDAVLVATAEDRADVYEILGPAQFEGDVQFALSPEEELDGVHLIATFRPDESSGELLAIALTPQHAEGPRGDYVYHDERVGNVAAWPTDDACGEGNHPLALDSLAVGVRPEDALYGMPTELAVRWEDGTETTAMIDFSPSGPPCITDACAEWCPAMVPATDADSAARSAIEIPVRLGIATADERWIGHLDASVWVEVFDAGGLARVFLRHASQHQSGRAIANDLGLDGINAAGMLTLTLLLEYAPPTNGALFIESLSGSGTLEVSDAAGGDVSGGTASAEFTAGPPAPPPTSKD